MNNININNIFVNNMSDKTMSLPPCKNIKISEFSIETLINSNTFKSSISDDYIINKIKLNKKKKFSTITDLYEIKYKECLIKINNAIELNLTDIICSIEIIQFGYDNYNYIECIKYIQNKLKKKNFLTLIISNKDIFISWKHIV